MNRLQLLGQALGLVPMGAKELVPAKEKSAAGVRADDAGKLMALDHLVDSIDACSEEPRRFFGREKERQRIQ